MIKQGMGQKILIMPYDCMVCRVTHSSRMEARSLLSLFLTISSRLYKRLRPLPSLPLTKSCWSWTSFGSFLLSWISFDVPDQKEERKKDPLFSTLLPFHWVSPSGEGKKMLEMIMSGNCWKWTMREVTRSRGPKDFAGPPKKSYRSDEVEWLGWCSGTKVGSLIDGQRKTHLQNQCK